MLEMQGYCHMPVVLEIFQATSSNPIAVINFDIQAQDHYAKQSFHMNDQSHLHLPLFTQLFTIAHASSSSSISCKQAASPPSLASSTKNQMSHTATGTGADALTLAQIVASMASAVLAENTILQRTTRIVWTHYNLVLANLPILNTVMWATT